MFFKGGKKNGVISPLKLKKKYANYVIFLTPDWVRILCQIRQPTWRPGGLALVYGQEILRAFWKKFSNQLHNPFDAEKSQNFKVGS